LPVDGVGDMDDRGNAMEGTSGDKRMKDIRPIFIVGAPRSGTSITTWALGQHPNIQPMPETAWIASMAVSAYLSYGKGSERGRFSHLSNVEFPLPPFMARIGEAVDAIVHDAFAERCVRFYGDRARDPAWTLPANRQHVPMQIKRSGSDPKRRWIDGTPLNSFYTWALAQMFPQALFIHNLRRPHEVATSLESFDKVGAEPQALEQGLETWISHTENAWHAERGLGSRRVFRLHFERIAGEPEALFREVCDFLGEPFHPDCLLPLRQKLNSSEVADKREANLAMLHDNEAFRRATATYQAVMARPGSAQPDPGALDVIRQRFMDYCVSRSII
jgi:hypothetical protein